VFLAGKLSYFINELLEDKRETGFYEIKRAFSKKEIGILEKIASEHVLDEKTEAKRFLDYAAKEDKEYGKNLGISGIICCLFSAKDLINMLCFRKYGKREAGKKGKRRRENEREKRDLNYSRKG